MDNLWYTYQGNVKKITNRRKLYGCKIKIKENGFQEKTFLQNSRCGFPRT